MKLIYSLFFLITFSVKIWAQVPITLSSSNFPSNNDTLRYSVAQLSTSINYTQTGTNYTWNYSSLIPTSQGLRAYKLGLLTSYAFFFSGLTEYGEKIADTLGAGPITITNYYNFYKKQTSPVNAYVVDGAGMTFSSIPVPSYYSDKDELYMFPMSYPKYDSTTFKYSTSSSTLIPIMYSKTGYRVTKVDGWGTITTPYGTAPCLRVVTTQYSQDSIKNTIFPIPFGFANVQRSYQWLTSTSKIPYLEVNGNVVGNNFTVTQIRYRDSYRSLASVKEAGDMDLFTIYPNPVSDKILLKNTGNGIVKAEVFDVNGKMVLSFTKEEIDAQKGELNVEKLSPGIYHLSLGTANEHFNFKFIKH